MKNPILILILIVSLGLNIYFTLQKFNESRQEKVIELSIKISELEQSNAELKKNNNEIRDSFIEIARSQRHLLEVLMKKTNLKKEFDAYQDLTEDEFKEATRRKIVALGLQIEQLEKDKP